MTELDGKQQRNALTAAERSLRALGDRNAERAVRSAAKATKLDQLGLFGGLPDAVAAGADDIESSGLRHHRLMGSPRNRQSGRDLCSFSSALSGAEL